MSGSFTAGTDQTHHSHTSRALVSFILALGFLYACYGSAFAESGYFIHIADPHVTPITKYRWTRTLEKILAESPPPDLVLCTGDLVEFGAGFGSSSNYDALLDSPITTDSGEHYIGEGEGRIPIFFCPGNHDYRDGLFRTKNLINYHDKVYSDTTYYHRIIGSYAIFSINSGHDIISNPPDDLPEGSGLFEADVADLENDLDMLDGVLNGTDTSNYNKIVFMHHPHPYPGEGPWCSADGVFKHYQYELLNMCEAYNVGWLLYGHLHPRESMVFDPSCDDWTSGETKCIIAVSAKTKGYRKEVLDGSGEDVIITIIPALSTWGIVAMTLLLLTGGALMLKRLKQTAA